MGLEPIRGLILPPRHSRVPLNRTMLLRTSFDRLSPAQLETQPPVEDILIPSASPRAIAGWVDLGLPLLFSTVFSLTWIRGQSPEHSGLFPGWELRHCTYLDTTLR